MSVQQPRVGRHPAQGAPGSQGTHWGNRPVRLTALYHEHLALGAVMEERCGWLLPVSYGDPAGEAAAVGDAAGLLDIGDMGKIDVQGDELDGLLADVVGDALETGRADPRSSGRVPSGWPAHAALPAQKEGSRGSRNEAEQLEASGEDDEGAPATGYPAGTRPLRPASGGMGQSSYIGMMRVLRLTDEHALLLTRAEQRQEVFERVRAAADGKDCVQVVDLTGALGGLRLGGPAAPAVLERLCAVDLSPDRFADGSVAEGAVARIHAIIARRDPVHRSRPSYGYELFVDRDLGVYLWESILEIGAPLGLRPVGRAVEEG